MDKYGYRYDPDKCDFIYPHSAEQCTRKPTVKVDDGWYCDKHASLIQDRLDVQRKIQGHDAPVS